MASALVLAEVHTVMISKSASEFSRRALPVAKRGSSASSERPIALQNTPHMGRVISMMYT
jgi:hypothetical protein